MTKEITKAYILQQIEDKFKLRELAPEKFTFSEMVIPIYDIEQHLKTWEVEYSTVSITATGSFEFFSVPYTESWLMRSYMLIFGATGAHKASGLLIKNRPTSSDFIYLDLVKGQEISFVNNLSRPVTLQPGNALNVYIDNYVSTQDLTVYIDVQKEEIR